MEGSEDLDSWLGQSLERPKEPMPGPILEVNSDVHMSDHDLTDLDVATSEKEEDIILVREVIREGGMDVVELSSNDEADDQDTAAVASSRANISNVYVEVPPLMDDYGDYEYLRGHYKVRRVVSEYKDGRFLVQLQSGESDLVSASFILLVTSILIAVDRDSPHR